MNAQSGFLFVAATTGKLSFDLHNTAGATSAGAVNDGQWHHVAVTFDGGAGGNVQLYIDGVASGNPVSMSPNIITSTVRIGASTFNGTDSLFFNGQIADVQAWGAARTAAEIASDMNGSPTGDLAQLVGHWPLSDSTGATVADVSGNGYAGTLTGQTAGAETWVATGPQLSTTATISAIEDTSISGQVTAIDPEGNAITYSAGARAATDGTVVVNADGTFTYTPNANFAGTDSFNIVASDGTKSTAQTISVTVAGVNDAPTFTTVAKTIAPDGSLALTATDFSAAMTDVEGDALSSITISSLPASGTLTLGGGTIGVGNIVTANLLGSLVYTPPTGYTGQDNFTWTGSDGQTSSSVTTMYLTVGGVTLTGTTGTDILYGGDYADSIDANWGNDTVYGGAGNDTIDGNKGNDTLYGDAGNDTITGGNGSDTISGGTGNDTIDGGTDLGIDVAVFAGARGDYGIVTVSGTTTVTANVGTDGIDTTTNMEILRFTDQDIILPHVLTGTVNADTITGNTGDDILNAGAGNDTVNGGAGNDTITSGTGTDTLTGGAGADIFRYTATTQSAVGAGDTITDFNAVSTDVINLQSLETGTFVWLGSSANGFTGATGGNNTEANFNDTTKLLQIDINGDGTADMDITLTGVALATLDTTDFTFA